MRAGDGMVFCGLQIDLPSQASFLTRDRPFFKKSERFVEPPITNQKQYSLYFNSENHGTSGPIRTTYSEEFGGSHPYWHATLNRLGVETNKNHFGGSNVGVVCRLSSSHLSFANLATHERFLMKDILTPG
jgi:hypothetical protein